MGVYNNADYINQSNRLLVAGRELLSNLNDPAKRSQAEKAAEPQATSQFGFEAQKRGGVLTQAGVEPDDGLRAVLFDIQAANVLIATGLATEAAQPNTGQLSQVLDQIEQSQAEMTVPVAAFQFEAGSSVKSTDLETAKKSFREDSHFSLDRFVAEASEVVQSVFDQLKKLEAAKVAQGIGDLGKPFQAAVDVGRLVKKGIEKLLKAVQDLLDLLGGDTLPELKARAEAIWNKLMKGEYVRDAITWSFGLKETESRIEKILTGTTLDLVELDGASNALRPLTESYESKIKLIKALKGAIVLIAGGLAYFHVAVPWLPLALAGAYAALVGATVLIGMNYCGAGGPLQWVKGVREIADGLSPAA